MNNLETAKAIKKAFSLLLKDTSTKATHGNDKAALDLIVYMTAENYALKAVGYKITDSGRLVKMPIEKSTDSLIDVCSRYLNR